MSVNNSSHDFYWTNKKRSLQRYLQPGQSFRLRLLKETEDQPVLQAQIVGPDMAGRPTETDWYDIDSFFNGLTSWVNGVLIQTALPQVSKSDREFIKTGMSNADWEVMTKG